MVVVVVGSGSASGSALSSVSPVAPLRETALNPVGSEHSGRAHSPLGS